MPVLIAAFLFFGLCLAWLPAQATQPGGGQLRIGQIQGRGSKSEWLGQSVHLRGIVTGVQEDENARGARFYTVFIQDLPGSEDGDPKTSDGIPIFFGATRPGITVGDVINVSGVVSEFYGLTEIDFRDLRWAIETRNHPLPEPLELVPPTGNLAADLYYEQFEGMLVELPRSIVVGPTHIGCGFAVVRDNGPPYRVFKHQINESGGAVINILHHTDVTCDSFPLVNFGDEIEGIKGPLTYHFEQFKIVLQDSASVEVKQKTDAINPQLVKLEPGQISLATFNLGNYFDAIDDTGNEAEPVLDPVAISVKKDKLAYAIANSLACPTIIGVQEVENVGLLNDLADMLEEQCDFHYQVTHREAPDMRGSDLALLSDPRHVVVTKVSQNQACTTIYTEVIDPAIACAAGLQPLFSRPPLQVDIMVDDLLMTILVNHLKSKRGGEAETVERRLAQAEQLQSITRSLLSENNDTAVAVVGDFNDYYQSPVMEELTAGGHLLDTLYKVHEEERYSYIFDGYSQLIDWILVSPALMLRVDSARVVHINADFHHGLSEKNGEMEIAYQSSDHDIPIIILQMYEARDRSLLHTPTVSVITRPEVQVVPIATTEDIPIVTIEEQETIAATMEPIGSLEEEETGKENRGQFGGIWQEAVQFRIGVLVLVVALGAMIVAFVLYRSRK